MTDETRPLRPLRSALFVPADKPRAIEKATGLGADALLLDLEDAVAPDRKSEARAAAPGAIARFRAAGRPAILRVAAPDAPELVADLQVVIAARPDAVLIAKTGGAAELAAVRQALNAAGWAGPLWAMIETPQGLLDFEADWREMAPLGLEAVIAGTNDLAEALRLPEGPGRRAALDPHLVRLLLAARAAGLAVLDGVYNAYQDPDGFKAEASARRALGFDGKSLIHPSQIALAHAVFTPTPDEIAWAGRVVAAFADPANAGKGAVALDGKMVELMHLNAARDVLAAARSAAGD